MNIKIKIKGEVSTLTDVTHEDIELHKSNLVSINNVRVVGLCLDCSAVIKEDSEYNGVISTTGFYCKQCWN